MSFLDDWMIFTDGNESPKIYHKWAGISVLSSAISRRVWYDAGFFTLFPNLYIILVGEPAGGKTMAMDQGRRLVQQLDLPVAPTASTKESILQLMSNDNAESPCIKNFQYQGEPRTYTHLSMFASEIVTTLSAGGNPLGFIEFLTDVWDREIFEYKTKNQGTDVIVGPFITLLGCMTPEQTESMLKQSIITGGFSRRCIFVFSLDRGQPVPRPEVTEEQEAARKRCVSHCKKMAQRAGEFKFAPATTKLFDQWYIKNYNRRSEPMPAVMKNYLRAKDGLVVKVSMLLALGQDPACELVIEPEHFHRALELLDEIEPYIVRVFEGTGRNVLADIASKIYALLEQTDTWVPAKKVYAEMFAHGDRDEIGKTIHHMEASDKLVRAPLVIDGVEAGQLLATKTVADRDGFPTPRTGLGKGL